MWLRNHAEALRQGRLLTESGARSEALLPVLERRIFGCCFLARSRRDEKGEEWSDVFAVLGIRGKTQQANLQQGFRLYSPTEIRRAFSVIVQADLDVKTGRLPSEIAVTLALNTMCRKQAANAVIPA